MRNVVSAIGIVSLLGGLAVGCGCDEAATGGEEGTGGSGGPACEFGPGDVLPPAPASGLSTDDASALKTHLEALSVAWVDDSVDAANTILTKLDYDAEDLEAFYDQYFVVEGHSLTDDLLNYLGYPTFHWFGPSEHVKLQLALSRALRRRVADLLATHTATLSADMDADAGLRQTLFNTNRIVATVGHAADLPEAEKRAIHDYYAKLIADHPVLKGDMAIDTDAYPWLAAYRANVQQAFTDVVALDACDIDKAGERLGLSGTRLSIWKDFGVIIHDNLAFAEPELEMIHQVLGSIPKGIEDLGHITQYERLGNVEPKRAELFSYRSVNVFDLALGVSPENPFPPDIGAKQADIFISVLTHEVNHIVDAHHIEPDAGLRARKEALIAQAGNVDLQYLRSQVGGAFFQNAPQEFFASISNEWFVDSAHTVDLARARFAAGYPEPINQALFFMEIYSAPATTRFYTAPFGSTFDFEDVPVTRDGAGVIVGLTYGGKTYNFTRDVNDNVTAISP